MSNLTSLSSTHSTLTTEHHCPLLTAYDTFAHYIASWDDMRQVLQWKLPQAATHMVEYYGLYKKDELWAKYAGVRPWWEGWGERVRGWQREFEGMGRPMRGEFEARRRGAGLAG